MKTADEYVKAVGSRLPRWFPGREIVLEDLRLHLSDRLEAGENEALVIGGMEPPEVYAAELAKDIDLNPASLLRRVAAFGIDMLLGIPVILIVGSIQALIMNLLRESSSGPDAVSVGGLSAGELLLMALISYPMVALLLLSFIYFPIVETRYGTTVGKHLLGLGVVAQNGTSVDLGKAFTRRIPFIFQFYLIDSLFALFSKTRQRAFDRVARTLVVTYPKTVRG